MSNIFSELKTGFIDLFLGKPIYKGVIDGDLKSDLQVEGIALVDRPAIEKNFIHFKKTDSTDRDTFEKFISLFHANKDKTEDFEARIKAVQMVINRNEQKIAKSAETISALHRAITVCIESEHVPTSVRQEKIISAISTDAKDGKNAKRGLDRYIQVFNNNSIK